MLQSNNIKSIQYWVYKLFSTDMWENFYNNGYIELIKDESENLNSISKSALKKYDFFLNKMEPGDVIFVLKDSHTICAKGIVSSECHLDESQKNCTHYIRKVNWTHKGEWIFPNVFPMLRLFEITSHTDWILKLELFFEDDIASLPVAYEGSLPYIFISYAHKDKNQVIPAITELQNAGYPVWYDAGIQAGTEWPEYIAEHLLKCSLVIAFISQNSIASDNCRQEITYALGNKKQLLAVKLDNCKMSPGMEMQLGLSQNLNAYKHKAKNGYINELIKAPIIATLIPKQKN